jgi:hypothetical protein
LSSAKNPLFDPPTSIRSSSEVDGIDAVAGVLGT